MVNPFHAGFGVSPPVLAGRDLVLDEFEQALDDGPGATGRATLFTGPRGVGKTVLLNAVEDRAHERGWLVVSETATPGFVHRMTSQHLPRLLREQDPSRVRHRLTGIGLPFGLGSASWEAIETHLGEAGLRLQLELLTDLMAERGAGVLITLDEIHHRQVEELRGVATAVQHSFREQRELAFVGAGLAASVSDVVNDDVLTFLRRADRHALAEIAADEVARAFRQPIAAQGRSLTPEALAIMVDAARGYPFLVQLIGAQTWRLSGDALEISAEHASAGVQRAASRLTTALHEPALQGISDVDRDYLDVMAQSDGPVRTAEVARRLGVTTNYAGQYRLRLIAADLIHPVRRGTVDFSVPYLREYLRSQSGGSA